MKKCLKLDFVKDKWYFCNDKRFIPANHKNSNCCLIDGLKKEKIDELIKTLQLLKNKIRIQGQDFKDIEQFKNRKKFQDKETDKILKYLIWKHNSLWYDLR